MAMHISAPPNIVRKLYLYFFCKKDRRQTPNYEIDPRVKKNDQLVLIGRVQDNTWYQVNIAGATEPGWIFAQTLQIVSGDQNSLPLAGPATPTPKPAARPSVQSTPTLIPLGTLPTPTSKP